MGTNEASRWFKRMVRTKRGLERGLTPRDPEIDTAARNGTLSTPMPYVMEEALNDPGIEPL